MFWNFYQNPRSGEVYNAGGGRYSNCSMIETIKLCEEISGNKLNHSYSDDNRIGDHIWYISDVSKFKRQYPNWNWSFNLTSTLIQIHDSMLKRSQQPYE